MRRFCRKLHYILLLTIFLFMITATGFPVHAEGDTGKVVRVGYYNSAPYFQDGFDDNARKSGYAYEYYQKIAAIEGWSYEYTYGFKSDIIDMLLSGELDIVAGIYPTDKYADQMLFSKYDMGLNGDECYFAINNKRADLMVELNHAQDKLLSSSPDFTMSLYQKYYSQNSQQQALTVSERAWLDEAGSLNIGYIRSNLPFSDQAEDGTPIGIVKELLASMSDYLEIPLNPICYDNIDHLEAGLKSGEIDAAFPIYSDLWITENKGFFQTDAFISDRVMLIYQGSYRDDLTDRIAVSRTGIGQRYYLSIYYPDTEVVFYDSKEAAFKAIQNNEANCMIGCSSILQRFFAENSDEYQNFHIAYLDTSEDFGMAVNRSENILVGILNKAIHQLDEAILTNAIVQYSSVEREFTFADFIRKYVVAVIAVLCVFFAILLSLFLDFRRKTNIYKVEQARTCAALEDALDAANAANAAKTTFLSSMSHDIRTPMNGIIGMTALAAAHIDNPAKVSDCLAKITVSGKHLLALINEVLDMSKIESGEIYLNEEVLDFSALIDDLIILNRPAVDARNHDLIVHILNITHEQVIGDSLRLQQIFTNLVGNAIKYTPEGGKIEITLSEKPSGSPRLGCFEFIVKDNGVGMSEEYLPHVFDAFTRADDEYSSQTQGTGLGMAITRNIVRMMNGDIKVESTLGEGTTFTVTLFLKLADTEHIPYEEFVDLNVLVVDDDQIICESSCLLMSELGLTSEWVLSGREAVERVEERHNNNNDYFAVLIDWKMPDMDGVATTTEIRKRIGNDVPIIIISAYDWSSIEEEATKAGANAFIGKPLFKSRLVLLFNQLLGNKKEENYSGLKELTEQTDFTGKRALMAEDNEINAEIAIEFLSMTGLAVDWAHDGKEALDMMSASAPGYYSCIFMDVQMPVMNGIEAAKAIRALSHPDAKTIPIFAMTANAFAEDVQAVLNAGMNEHIAKPLNFDILLTILNNYLN